MKKNKQKKLKKLKRINVVPHIIILVLFLLLVPLIFVGLGELYLESMIDNRIKDSYSKSNSIVEILEGQDLANIDKTSLPQVDWLADDYGVYDTQSESFVIAPNQEIVFEDLSKYAVEDKTIYFSRINDVSPYEFVGSREINASRFAMAAFKRCMHDMDKFLADDAVDEDILVFNYWIIQPIGDGQYSLYYCAASSFTVGELLYLFAFAVLIILAIALPIIFYVITLILSITGQRRAAKLLYYDPVIGGKNWLAFEEDATRVLKRNRGKRNYAVISFRMGRFQSYCACYGNKAGDEVVNTIYSALVTGLVKRKEIVARYSDAEFAMLYIVESHEQLEARLTGITNSLISALQPHKIDFKIGICDAESGTKIDALYSNASIARKNIDSNPDKRIAWYDAKIKENQLWEHYVEENMESALNNGELHVYLQPKYNASTEILGGAEALIRWISPTKGFIGPGRFIPIFEKNGFITKIDDFMLSSVAKLQAKWVAEGKNVVPISVNISRAHFTQADLAEHLCKIVEDAGAPKELIELELTESAFFEDKDILIDTVNKLKTLGFKISMDDFGAGYSSLNSLKDLKLDVLKLDADFFRGKEENEDRGSLIVTETIQLAKNLGMTTVAEGIESADQVEFLANSGCDLIQGYYFAKPMPVADYEKKMEEGKAIVE